MGKRDLAALFFVGVLLSGCSTTSGLDASVARSGFDGATVVTIPTHGTRCGSMSAPCLGLAAQWSSKSPSESILQASVLGEYKAITGAALSINGVVVRLQPASFVTDFSKPGDPLRTSSASFTVPLDLLKNISQAQSVWLRLYTPTGYVEDAVKDGESDSKALHAIGRFLQAVDGAAPKTP